MHKPVFLAVSAFAAVALAAAPAMARPRHKARPAPRPAAAAPAPMKAEVVERDAHGRATAVSVEGTRYKVCTATLTDGCINPRQAGLNFGNAPLDHWPGQPASEMKGPKGN